MGRSRSSEPTDGAIEVAGNITAPTNTVVAPVDAPVLGPGTMLGDYEIEEEIGAGGMGVVFAAVHPVIGKRAAIKVLRPELCRDPAQVQRFVDEARAVNRIGHPNIVDVFAFGEMPDGRSYLVMEWLRGESLARRLARGPMSIPEVCDVLRPLSRALEAAHESGVIHRDLKPDNVFLVEVRDDKPLVKLLDFGIAKLQHGDRQIDRTATGQIIGTPKYIAPEQARGHAIDARVDIYSLGAIAFELLTGRCVFDADNAMEMVAKHLMEPPPRPSAFVAVPRELDDLVHAMLAKAAVDRPSLAQVAAVLERASAWTTWAGMTAPPPAPARTRRAFVALAVTGTLAAAGIAFAVVHAMHRPPAATPPAETAVTMPVQAAPAPVPAAPAPVPAAPVPAPVAPPPVVPMPSPTATPPHAAHHVVHHEQAVRHHTRATRTPAPAPDDHDKLVVPVDDHGLMSN